MTTSDSFKVLASPFSPTYGQVCILVNGQHFPDVEWSDFIFNVLGDWASISRQLADGECQEHYFFDGPWMFVAHRAGDSVSVVCGSRYPHEGERLPSCTVSYKDYQRTIIDACMKAKSAAEDLGFQFPEGFAREAGLLKKAVDSPTP